MAKNALTSFLRRLRTAALLRDGSGPTDAQLLRRFIDFHDETAFEALVRLHAPMVLGVCQRLLHNPEDAEDAFQATFLVLVQKAHSLSKSELVGNWLHGVAHRTALKTRTMALRRQRMERQIAVMPEPQTRDSECPWRELRPLIDAALQVLPRKYRDVILLCDVENKSHQEAARQIGCPVGTIHSRLARGRALLAKQLTHRGITLSSAALATTLTHHATAASVPCKLIFSTVQSACAWGAGGTTAGVVSLEVGALTKGVLRAMFLAKLKYAALTLFAFGVVGLGGVGAWLRAGVPQAKLAQVDDVSPAKKVAAAPEDPNDEIDKLAAQLRKGPRVDLHGDALPPDAIARFGTRRFASHGGNQLAYTADGGHIVVATGAEAIVYETATGREVRRIRPKAERIRLAGAGKLIALGVRSPQNAGPKSIQIVDLTTGKIVRECTDAVPQTYTSVRLSPDATMLAAYLPQNKTICLLDLVKGQELRRWKLVSPSECFTFSPDGKTLIAGDGWRIRFWNVATGAETRLINHRTMVHKVVLSPDGKTLVSQAESLQTDLCLWDVATGKKIGDIEAFVLADKGTHPRMFEDPQIFQFEFSPDGKSLLTIGFDGLLNVWDPATGKRLQRWDTSALETYPYGYPYGAGRFALTATGKIAALLGPGGFVRFLDLASGREKPEHTGHRYDVQSIAFSPSGQILASTSLGPDATIRLWNGITGQEERRFSPSDAHTFTHCYYGDHRTLITLSDSYGSKEIETKLQVWDFISGKKLHEVRAPITKQGWRLHTRSPNGQIIGTITEDEQDSKIILWDAGSGKKIRELIKAKSYISALGFSVDNRNIYSGNLDISSGRVERKVLVWDAATGSLAREFSVVPAERSPLDEKKDVHFAVFSLDGKWFICRGTAGELLLYDTATGKQVRRVAMFANKFAFACSPDQRTLAIGTDDGAIQLVEFTTGKLRHRITGAHEGGITVLAFSADSRRLGSGSDDTTALVWDLTGRLAGKRQPLSPLELDGCWSDLKSDDAGRAYQAIRRLTVTSAQAVALFGKHLQPVPAPDRKRQARLIADLASDVFATRQAATKELTQLGEMAETALREALDKPPTTEARVRIQQLLTKIEQIDISGEPLRHVRAVETLERIGTAAARRLLEKFAAGDAQARLTKEAKAALERLRKR